MNFNKKTRGLLAVGLLCTSLLLSGCSNDVDSQFIFGKNRIHCDNQTITITTPFELISNGKQVDLGARNASKVNAEGHNNHMQIIVVGDQSTVKHNETTLTAEALNMLKNNESVTNLKEKAEEVIINGIHAKLLTFSFTETGRGQSTDLTVKEYIFTQNDTVWRVIYQYRTNDPTGKELTDKVAGQIILGSHF